MKPQYRIAHLLKLTLVVAVVMLLWQLASIERTVPPSVLPGPIWFIKFFVPWPFVGSNPLAHLLVGAIVALSLAVGISIALFRSNRYTLLLSFCCIVIWIWIGVVMRSGIMATLGV